MKLLKKAWLTKHTDDLCTLTLESAFPQDEDRKRIHIDDNLFPNNPTPEHPLRHTIIIGMLSREDLINLESAITTYINS